MAAAGLCRSADALRAPPASSRRRGTASGTVDAAAIHRRGLRACQTVFEMAALCRSADALRVRLAPSRRRGTASGTADVPAIHPRVLRVCQTACERADAPPAAGNRCLAASAMAGLRVLSLADSRWAAPAPGHRVPLDGTRALAARLSGRDPRARNVPAVVRAVRDPVAQDALRLALHAAALSAVPPARARAPPPAQPPAAILRRTEAFAKRPTSSPVAAPPSCRGARRGCASGPSEEREKSPPPRLWPPRPSADTAR